MTDEERLANTEADIKAHETQPPADLDQRWLDTLRALAAKLRHRIAFGVPVVRDTPLGRVVKMVDNEGNSHPSNYQSAPFRLALDPWEEQTRLDINQRHQPRAIRAALRKHNIRTMPLSCHRNCQWLLLAAKNLQARLQYREGTAQRKGGRRYEEHAWLTFCGRIVDLTWDARTTEYGPSFVVPLAEVRAKFERVGLLEFVHRDRIVWPVSRARKPIQTVSCSWLPPSMSWEEWRTARGS